MAFTGGGDVIGEAVVQVTAELDPNFQQDIERQLQRFNRQLERSAATEIDLSVNSPDLSPVAKQLQDVSRRAQQTSTQFQTLQRNATGFSRSLSQVPNQLRQSAAATTQLRQNADLAGRSFRNLSEVTDRIRDIDLQTNLDVSRSLTPLLSGLRGLTSLTPALAGVADAGAAIFTAFSAQRLTTLNSALNQMGEEGGRLRGSIANLPPIFQETAVSAGGASGGISQLSGAMSLARGNAVGLAAAAAVALGALSIKLAGPAASAAESLNAVRVTLGTAADEFIRFGQTASTQLGISQQALNQLVVPIAAILQNSGLSGGALAQSLQDLTTRATDLASVFNVDVSESITAIGSALRGETEPIRRFGVNFSDAAVQAQALRLNLARTRAEISEDDKVMARLSLTMQQTNRFAGDFQNTLGESLPNQLRVLNAEWEELTTQLSSVFLPVATDVVTALNGILGATRDVVGGISGFIGAIDNAINAADDWVARNLPGPLKGLGASAKDAEKDVKSLGGTMTLFGDLGSKIFGQVSRTFTNIVPRAQLQNAVKTLPLLQAAQANTANAQKRLNELKAEFLRVQQDTTEEVRAEAEATANLQRAAIDLADNAARRLDIEQKIRELNSPASEDDLADAREAIERAQIELNKQLRRQLDIEEDLKETEEDRVRIALNLRGLSLDQMRGAIANARASVEALRQTQKDNDETIEQRDEELTLAERQRLLELDRLEAARDLREAQERLTELQNTQQRNQGQILDLERQLQRLDQDRLDTLREQENARNNLQAIQRGDTARTAELARLEREIKDQNAEIARLKREEADAQIRLIQGEGAYNRLLEERTLKQLRSLDLTRQLNSEINQGLKSSVIQTVGANFMGPISPQMAQQITQPRVLDALAQGLINNPGSDLKALLRQIFRSIGLNIPGFKDGGLIEGTAGPMGQLARLGEYGKSELVLPLTNASRTWELLAQNLPKMPATLRASLTPVLKPSSQPQFSMANGSASTRTAHKANADLAEAIVSRMEASGLIGTPQVVQNIELSAAQDPAAQARMLRRETEKTMRKMFRR